MSQHYKVLQQNFLANTTYLYQPSHMLEGEVGLSDPAMFVFTDFQRITPLTIEASATLEKANQKMILCGVRLLLVCNDEGNIEGLITSDDIFSEKPVRYINEHGGAWADVLVLDVMTHHKQLESIDLNTVLNAVVGDIVETIKFTGKHHLLVTENVGGQGYLRGLFSRTQIARQIGDRIRFSNRANTFAELEQALVANS